jgi:GGDEF-like domain/PucR C-terminal helix-turn-helix domain
VATTRRATGIDGALLDGYADVLTAAATTGRAPGRDELDRFRALGMRAAEDNIAPRALVDAYLIVLERSWAALPDVADAPTAAARRAAAAAVLAAARRAIGAVTQGYEQSQRQAVQRDEAVRREFIDDLLGGRGDLGRLAERAQRFGVLLSGGHVVAVARGAQPLTPGATVRRIEDALVARFGTHNVLLTTRDELLVCVTPSSLRGVPGELAHQMVTAFGTDTGWQVSVGRPHSGPSGVLRSYEEARNALDLSARLGFRAPVLNAADLLVFPVLLRDRAAITDLIATVLGPLAKARGGAGPLLATLEAFFASQGNSSATARRLGISVRAVGYRLERVRQLTGYAPTEPTQRFTLEAAVLGARLLDWPAQPLAP